MSRHHVAAAAAFLVLVLIMPFAAQADSPCARGATEFCLGTAVKVPSTVLETSWTHWAAGSRMRLGGWSSGAYVIEADEPDGAAPYVGRIPLAAAAQGARLHPRLGYGLGVQSNPAGAMFASFPLSESFSLDLTAGKGRIGLRAAPPDAAYALGPGSALQAGPGFDRAAWSIALNASRQIGAFGIGGRIGYVDVRDQPDVLFDTGGASLAWGGERTLSLRKSFLGFDASYDITRNWQLHGGAIYRRDEGRMSASLPGFGAPYATDRDEKEWGIGVRYYGWRNFKLNVEFLKSSGRDQFGNESLLFTGRFDF